MNDVKIKIIQNNKLKGDVTNGSTEQSAKGCTSENWKMNLKNVIIINKLTYKYQ